MLVAMLAGLVADWVGDIKATQTHVRRNGERLSRAEADMETLTNDVASLKETQAKQSEILTQIRARQTAMEVSRAAMKATQAQIKATQTEIKATQAEPGETLSDSRVATARIEALLLERR